ncbi:DnaJ family domain-containing protein [Herbiconiux sp. UC225_62]|uniref:DnaJ family domain-containing protein n=1 Tax=Herbiconiux sp. UC225_62 TaxID=3350168 RepID=UPI0036D2CBC4
MDDRMRSDSRVNAARYQVDRLSRELDADTETAADTEPAADTAADAGGTADAQRDDETHDAGAPTMEQRAQFVEIQIRQAMRRGDFDDLPGAGKPLTHLTETYDPNWWIRRKIERERLTGLGPPALTLRTEDAALDERIDEAGSERAVRELLTDFNRRVVEARRQLQGGPPVITATRDVDAEVERWRERREARRRARDEERAREEAARAAMTWRERRAARRAERTAARAATAGRPGTTNSDRSVTEPPRPRS